MIVPFLNPTERTDRVIILLEKLTGLVVFALNGGTTVVIDIILPAVPEKRVKLIVFSGMTEKVRTFFDVK